MLHLREQLGQAGRTTLFFFASPRYDMAALGAEMWRAFGEPGSHVLGCTSAGEIGPRGYQEGGITALAIRGDDTSVTPYVMPSFDEIERRTREITEAVEVSPRGAGQRRVGLLLVDGLSAIEERLAYLLYRGLGDVPLVGGSSGEDHRGETALFCDGRLLSRGAVFTVLTTSTPFVPVKLQSYQPSDRKLVVTRSDVKTRTVHEINGLPTLEAYSEMIGVPAREITFEHCSRYPLVRSFHGKGYVRSPRALNPDGSLTFYCALEEGMVLSLAESLDSVTTLRDELAKARASVTKPGTLLGFECIQRRRRIEREGAAEVTSGILRDAHVIGFNTFGEQWNGLHVNETFTGLLFGT